MIIKILKIIGKSTLYLVAALLLGFSSIFAFDFYYSIRGFHYVEPQPNYLLTIEETRENQESYFSFITEADTRMGCIGQFKLIVPRVIFDDNSITIDIDGLYQRKKIGCIPAGLQRPKFRTSVDFSKKEGDSINLIINFQQKTDKYKIEILTGGKSIISPHNASFSEIIAYRYNNKLEWKTEKYLLSN